MSAYYKGPDGVFYNKVMDNIFVLEWTGGRWVNKKTGKENGRVYRFWTRGKYRAKTALINMHYCVRLGAL